MIIKLFLSDSLSNITKGKDLFQVNGRTVGECLHHLVTLAPVMKEALFLEDRLYPTIKVSVNQESLDGEVLAKPLKDGDEIYIELDRH